MADGEGGARPGRGEVLAGLGARLSRMLPDEARGRRRVAEVGAVAGVAIVVLALVGATVALRPTSAPPTTPEGPGLPVPVEVLTPASTSAAPTGTASSSPVIVVPGPTGRTPYEPLPTRRRLPTVSGSPTSPAPSTSRASAPVTTPPPATKPPTPSPTPSPSPSPTASASTSSAPPTDPTDPPVPPKPRP